MNKSAIACLFLFSLGLVSCTSTGAPSGGIIGLVTGGLLGHLVDGESDSSSSGGLFGSSNNNSSSSGAGTTSGNGVTPLLLGSTTTNSTDAATGTTTEAIKNQYAVVNANGGGNSNNEDDFFGNNKGAIVGAAAGAISGMVTDSFRKGEIERKYQEGYAKAKSDAIKEFYWLKRDAQKAGNGGEDAPVQYRYYEVEVPAHVNSDGVMIERHKRVIEVVE